jgi:hypothetical protein
MASKSSQIVCSGRSELARAFARDSSASQAFSSSLLLTGKRRDLVAPSRTGSGLRVVQAATADIQNNSL